jgi:hypothetical protein
MEKLNKKFKLLNESLKAISKGTIQILILKGDAGNGKSYTTLKYLKDNNKDFGYIDSYATPLGFYEILYNNKDKDIIIFDDVHGIQDSRIISMFKSACWNSQNSNKKRTVSYHSTGKREQMKLPDSCEIKSKIILILNEDIKGFEPIINRGISINFDFSFKEKIKIFKNIKDKKNIDEEVIKYIEDHCDGATSNLSIRTLVILSSLKRDGFDFKLFAEEILKVDEDLKLLMETDEKTWCEKTKKHRSTYYRLKNKTKL